MEVRRRTHVGEGLPYTITIQLQQTVVSWATAD